MTEKFLEIRNVSKIYRIGGLIRATKIAAVDNVNLSLEQGKAQVLSLVGESGSGKRRSPAWCCTWCSRPQARSSSTA